VAVGVEVAVAVAVAVGVAVAVAVGVGVGHPSPFPRLMFSANAPALKPPVLQTRPGLTKPAELPCRAEGRTDGEGTQAPAGQALISSSSTKSEKSLKPPPFVSPPMAKSFVPDAASPKSARAGVNAGPVVHTPGALVISSR
jgi:hypothetical protein